MQTFLRHNAPLPALGHAGSGKETAKSTGGRGMPHRNGRRILHGRRHCEPAGNLPACQAVWRARDGRRCAWPWRYRRGRTRNGELLWPGRPSGCVYGHVLQIACKSWRLYGGVQPRGRLRAAQFAALHLLCVHPARKLRGSLDGAAGAGAASGAGCNIAGERAVFKTPAGGERN